MGKKWDEKGVSPIIGFILISMVLVVFLSVLQTTKVPEVCEETEADHIKKITSQLIELKHTSSTQATKKFDMGVNYPEYLFLNTPDSSATTMNAEEFEISAEFTEILPNGTHVERSKNFTSNRIILSPNYYYYPQERLILENTAILKHASGNYISISDQTLFKYDIKIVLINTTFNSISTTQSLNIVPTLHSGGGKTLATNLSISFESINPDYWKSISSHNVTVSDDKVTINSNDTLLLGIRSVMLSSGTQVISKKPEPIKIIKTNSLDNFSLKKGDTITLGVKVLDEYGNPVEGVKVEANSSIGEVTPSILYTGSDGEVHTRFVAQVPSIQGCPPSQGVGPPNQGSDSGSGEVEFTTNFDNTSYNLTVLGCNKSSEKEEMKYITVNTTVQEKGNSMEKNFTVVEIDYVKSLRGQLEFKKQSFKWYLNKILEDQKVTKINYWQRGHTGELVTGVINQGKT